MPICNRCLLCGDSSKPGDVDRLLGGATIQVERRGARHSAPSASPAPTASPPLTGEVLAERLGVSGETVRRWSKEGMPSCGTHPERPSWPVYDEAAYVAPEPWTAKLTGAVLATYWIVRCQGRGQRPQAYRTE